VYLRRHRYGTHATASIATKTVISSFAPVHGRR
jgi:hypothetical protein